MAAGCVHLVSRRWRLSLSPGKCYGANTVSRRRAGSREPVPANSKLPAGTGILQPAPLRQKRRLRQEEATLFGLGTSIPHWFERLSYCVGLKAPTATCLYFPPGGRWLIARSPACDAH